MQEELVSPPPTRTDSQRAMLEALTAPFDQKQVSWRVTATANRERGRSGLVMPFADPRSYTDRLNQVATPAGWTRSFSVTTVAPLFRQKKEGGKTVSVQTAKIVVTCTVTIPTIGSHSSTGEAWADEEQAVTSAEARAFKRACMCFGLGRYFYDFSGQWVPVDDKGKILETPKLPSWALPKAPGKGQAPPATKAGSAATTTSASSEQQAPANIPQPASGTAGSAKADSEWIDQWIERFKDRLGPALFSDILEQVRKEMQKNRLSLDQTRDRAISMLELAERGLQKVGTLSEQIGEQTFARVLDEHKIPSMLEFPSLKAVIAVYNAAMGLATPPASASRRAA